MTHTHTSSPAHADVRVNAIDVDELFRRYEQAGFIYPAKKRQLAPYWEQVLKSWRAGVRGGELILWFNTYDHPEERAWATLSSWRSTHTGWITQHLASFGNPRASRAVMLAGQATRIRDGFDHAHQNWFQPAKRMPMRLFGSIPQSLGPEHSSVGVYCYVALPLACAAAVSPRRLNVRPWRADDAPALFALGKATRGHVYAIAEELDHPDATLQAVDDLYRRVGLRRYRNIWLAGESADGTPKGAILAYRGPLGFNFSFIENRCDLLIPADLPDDAAEPVVHELVRHAAAAYADFEPQAMLITCDERTRRILERMGGQFIRSYAQSIWLRQGFDGWYQHVDRFYERIFLRTTTHCCQPSEADAAGPVPGMNASQRSPDHINFGTRNTEPAQ